MWLEILKVIICSYVIGSIPTAVWIGKSFFGTDVREHGSKNAGATNTFRVLGKKAGSIVLIIDIIKGWGAVSIVHLLISSGYNAEVVAGFTIGAGVFAILGHIFPVFAKFDGGKGVATSLGVVIAIHPLTALVCFCLFLVTFLLSHYVSLGAIVAAIAFPLVLAFIFKVDTLVLLIFATIMSLMVLITHRKNIGRLLNREENKMYLK